MRILQVNNHHRIIGGTERYYFELSDLLIQHKHQVAHFSMFHPDNQPTSWSQYFIKHFSFEHARKRDNLKVFSRTLYCFESRQKISLLLDKFRPDIVHIHNIYNHISPSILMEIKKRHIPIIQTVHDYHLLGPNSALFHSGKICEIYKKGFYRPFFHKCVGGSYLPSITTTLALFIHSKFKIYSKNIDYFIAPSIFMKNKLIEYGFNADKIIHLPYFVNIAPVKISTHIAKPYILYFGQLREHKGVHHLISAIRRISNVRLKIIGGGPQRQKLQKIPNKDKNIVFLPHQPQSKLFQLIKQAEFCVVPSVWYENFPLSILESFSFGKPVIGSNIGGIPELVKHNRTGLLFRPSNIDDLTNQIKTLWQNKTLINKLGNNAQSLVKNRLNPEHHYYQLMNIYESLLTTT